MNSHHGGIFQVAPLGKSSRSHSWRIPPGSYVWSEPRGFDLSGGFLLWCNLPRGFLRWCVLSRGFLHGATYPEVSSGGTTYGGLNRWYSVFFFKNFIISSWVMVNLKFSKWRPATPFGSPTYKLDLEQRPTELRNRFSRFSPTDFPQFSSNHLTLIIRSVSPNLYKTFLGWLRYTELTGKANCAWPWRGKMQKLVRAKLIRFRRNRYDFWSIWRRKKMNNPRYPLSHDQIESPCQQTSTLPPFHVQTFAISPAILLATYLPDDKTHGEHAVN